MAFMNCRMRSKELKKEVEINVILPVESGAPKRVLYLLHGLAGDASSWMRRTSIERYATARNRAADMPRHQNLRAVAPGESLVEAVKKQ